MGTTIETTALTNAQATTLAMNKNAGDTPTIEQRLKRQMKRALAAIRKGDFAYTF